MRHPRVRFTVRRLMAVVAGAGALLVVVKPVFAPPPPPPSAPTYTFRFGTMPQRNTGRHAWSLTNPGPTPLRVYLVSHGICEVSGIMYGRDGLRDGQALTIPPGGKAQIVMKWETRGANGLYIRSAQIGTDHPETPYLRFVVEGVVQ